MIEMVAAIEFAHGDQLDGHSNHEGRDQRQHGAQHEALRERRKGRGEISAQHIERAMRQIDQVHDAEHQRQPGGQQEQQQPELQPVQALFDEQNHFIAHLSWKPS